ncbi:UNVERIFIED_CONTAM: hypothetical protein FKN15_061761 [Acipenser sinensis]
MQYFAQKFKNTLQFDVGSMDKLYEEYLDYQSMRKDVPEDVWKEAEMKVEPQDGSTSAVYHQMDVLWAFLSTVKFPGSAVFRFPCLSQIACLVLVVPHSNADEERLFSQVCKNKTEFRPNLDIDRSLSSIITVKVNNKEPCNKFQPDRTFTEGKKGNMGIQQATQQKFCQCHSIRVIIIMTSTQAAP